MTQNQAAQIVRLLLAAFPSQELEKATLALYLAYLRAIPWREGHAEDGVRVLIAQQQSSFFPAIGAVVAACGLPPAASPLLVVAMREEREVIPDDTAVGGWTIEHGPPDSSVDELSLEERRANLRRLGGLAREFGAKRSAT